MEEINLLQNRIKDKSFAWQKQSRIAIGVLSVLFILILVASGLIFLLNQQVEKELVTAKTDVAKLESELAQREASLGEAKTFQAQLLNLRGLMSAHVYLSPLFDELAKNTYANAKFLTVDVGTDGRIHIEGQVPDYEEMSKVLLGLTTSDKFVKVKLFSVTPSSGTTFEYNFSLDVVADPKIFSKNP